MFRYSTLCRCQCIGTSPLSVSFLIEYHGCRKEQGSFERRKEGSEEEDVSIFSSLSLLCCVSFRFPVVWPFATVRWRRCVWIKGPVSRVCHLVWMQPGHQTL